MHPVPFCAAAVTLPVVYTFVSISSRRRRREGVGGEMCKQGLREMHPIVRTDTNQMPTVVDGCYSNVNFLVDWVRRRRRWSVILIVSLVLGFVDADKAHHTDTHGRQCGGMYNMGDN